MVSVKIILDNRRQQKDGTSPLKLRIVLNRQTYHVFLGHRVIPKDWDENGQKIKSSCKTIDNITRFNALIQKEKQKALSIFTQLEEDGQLETLSFEEIRRHLDNKHTEAMTLAFAEEIIASWGKPKNMGMPGCTIPCCEVSGIL